MEYLDKVLGVKVIYEDVEFKHLPNFIATRYRLQMVSMNEQKAVFLYLKTELERIEVLKKHIARIQKNENLPVVLVLKELSFRPGYPSLPSPPMPTSMTDRRLSMQDAMIS